MKKEIFHVEIDHHLGLRVGAICDQQARYAPGQPSARLGQFRCGQVGETKTHLVKVKKQVHSPC